jgi:hypothetical protein
MGAIEHTQWGDEGGSKATWPVAAKDWLLSIVRGAARDVVEERAVELAADDAQWLIAEARWWAAEYKAVVRETCEAIPSLPRIGFRPFPWETP